MVDALEQQRLRPFVPTHSQLRDLDHRVQHVPSVRDGLVGEDRRRRRVGDAAEFLVVEAHGVKARSKGLVQLRAAVPAAERLEDSELGVALGGGASVVVIGAQHAVALEGDERAGQTKVRLRLGREPERR